jgi:hypothetical protein
MMRPHAIACAETSEKGQKVVRARDELGGAHGRNLIRSEAAVMKGSTSSALAHASTASILVENGNEEIKQNKQDKVKFPTGQQGQKEGSGQSVIREKMGLLELHW